MPYTNPQAEGSRRVALTAAVVLLAAILAVAGAWRWTPLHDYAEPREIAHWLISLRHSPWAVPVVLSLYLAASAVLFPNTLLNVAVILAMGTGLGLAYALGGSLAAAAVFYGLGARYGQERLQSLHIRGIDKLSRMLRKGGIPGMAGLRLLPIAPFSVVNLAAGALRVRFWTFMAGTLLGLLPGNLLVTAFGHQLRALLREPGPGGYALMGAILVAGALWLAWLRRRAQQEA
jgi:phospholipase D1/2